MNINDYASTNYGFDKPKPKPKPETDETHIKPSGEV